ncbi:MAG: dihydrofolate reductase, partial [Defluviitaleaceae bacterium]|nr:dihydrofolate reductase [Defluviitaleaceae bacterium]
LNSYKNLEEEVFIIGGAQIYKQALNSCDKLYITLIHESFEADTYFPEIDENRFKEADSLGILESKKNSLKYEFKVYEKKVMKLASLFAGIGGIDLGFEQAGFNPVWANEIDVPASETFRLNHSNVELIVEDICKIDAIQIPNVDVLAGGFPCQAFSVAGYRKGFDDDRGNLFFQIIRLLSKMEEQQRLPKVVFLENVKNLHSHDNGNTFKVIKTELEKLGYHLGAEVLNSMEYGNVPQNRERIYIVAFLDRNALKRFKWPEKMELSNTLGKVICRSEQVDKKYYYSNDKKTYSLLKENIKNKTSVYQFRRVYVRENKSGVSPTLTANMGMGGHNVPLILDNNNDIRKFTPRECLNLQGFPKDFKIPKDLPDSQIYKQAGNSVTVPVIKSIAEAIKKAVSE